MLLRNNFMSAYCMPNSIHHALLIESWKAAHLQRVDAKALAVFKL